jgi:Tol biopolymer transport system component
MSKINPHRFDRRRSRHGRVPLVLGALCATAGVAFAAETTRVTIGDAGEEATYGCTTHYARGMNGAATVVAFHSDAANLVAGDGNDASDIFVRDLRAGRTTRVSVAGDGTEADGDSRSPSVSTSGRILAFTSLATNLVDGDTNGVQDVFVHDRRSGQTRRVSVNSAGIEANAPGGVGGMLALSGDGGSIFFSSTADNLAAGDTNGEMDLFRHDLRSGETLRVSMGAGGVEADETSGHPSPSANGKIVAFTSLATNLVPDDANGEADVFVHDIRSGSTARVSVAAGGGDGDGSSGIPALSNDGRIVAFVSHATNLVAGDANGATDIFVRDLKAGVTTRVSVAGDGSEGNGDSFAVALSGNGRYVIFASEADNLVDADTNGESDVFVHDRKTGATIRVNVDGAGVQSTGRVGTSLALSTNGKLALFSSTAATLVAGDGNGVADLFLHSARD